MLNLMSDYFELSQDEVAYLSHIPAEQVYHNSRFLRLFDLLDTDVLEKSLPRAHALLDYKLPVLLKTVLKDYNLTNTPMSSYTLTNWLLGYLSWPEQLPKLIQVHQRVPVEAFITAAPHIVHIFDEMGEEGLDWQRAFLLLVFPMTLGKH